MNEDPAVVARFATWTERYLAAGPDRRASLLAEGEAAAAARRTFLHELIASDPETALSYAVPGRVRRALPERIGALLEESVSGRGSYSVLIADEVDAAGTITRAEIRREVVLGARKFEAFVYGPRLFQPSRARLALRGIAVGRRLAVHQDAVRRLGPDDPDLFQPPGPDRLCPVSSRPAAAASRRNSEIVAAEVAGKVEYFCGAGHLALLQEALAGDAGSGGPGGGEPPVAPDNWTQGPKSCLFMRVAFPDDPAEPISEDGAYAMMDSVNQWFTENSYDTTSLITTVTPLLRLGQTKAWYGAQGTSTLLADAREAAREAGLDPDNYHWDVLRHNSVPGFGWAGLGYVRGKGTWLQSSSVGVAVHELGHNFGLWHANFWSGAADGIIGPGSHGEYGNSFDTMGAASAGNNQFNAAFKNQLDWLPDAFVDSISSSGTYRLHTFDVPNLTSGRKYALKVRKNYGRDYWVEFRQKFSGNRWLLNGVLLNWSPWNNGVTNSAGGTHLLDATPGTGPGKDDAAVVIGRTFSDRAAGFHLTPIARGTDSPENWIDVVIHLGVFPDNHPPIATLVTDRESAPTNGPVHFTAFGADPDGDVLAYGWDFGDDTFGPNAPSVSKSWANPGEYVVRLTVSDMKGGSHTETRVVTIGSPASFRVMGRVTDPAGEPVEGVRVHNGGTGAAYRVTRSDSDGYYALVNLPEGATTISAVKYGYALARDGWTNPIAIGPGSPAGALSFVATADPVVSIAASDASAAESGLESGRFTIVRVGPTNTALAVRYNRTGSASFPADYQLSPASTNSPLQVVIPAGAAEIDVVLRPNADALGEGPEQVTLSLIENAAYVLGPLAEATVWIVDDDPSGPPNVSVSVTGSLADNTATESGRDAAVFTFTRNGGNTAQEIVVRYAVGGTATPGDDYAPLPGVVTIPAGQTLTAVGVTAVDDVEVEPNETIVITLQPDAGYLGGGGTATLTLIDNDPATVTIAATDAVAREAGGNSGTFTVTRVGSLAANLMVSYALGGTAVNSNDYSRLTGRVTIPAGRATATFSVSPVNDAFSEGDETVVVTLLATPSCNIGIPGEATMVITDDELPTVTLAATDNVASEGNPAEDPGAFTFSRNGSNPAPLTVYFKVDGTALGGSDYEALGDRIEIPAGETNVVLYVTARDDAFREAAERVTVTLVPGPGYNVGTGAPQAVSIQDNDSGLPAVGFTLAASSGPENETFVRLSVSLSTNSASAVTVQYAVTGGTAAGGGVDHALGAGTLTVVAGKVNQSISFGVNNDALAEEPETVQVTLSAPTGAVLDANATHTHTYTILDDDTSGALTVTALDDQASEAGERGVFRISRSGGVQAAQPVKFEVVGSAGSPSDYQPIGRTAVIPAGVRFVDLAVIPVDDVTDETSETVVLTLQPVAGASLGFPDTATVTIVDNDDGTSLPVVTVTASDPAAAEPGADRGVFVLARDRGTNEPLVVAFTLGGTAVAGTDYSNLLTSVTIPAGVYTTNVVVSPRDDAAFEPLETVVLTLTQPDDYRVGTPSSATIGIVDNESGVSLAAEGAANESGTGDGRFIFSRTGSTASNLTVSFVVGGTAVNGADLESLANAIVIPAGTNRVELPVTALDDVAPEGAETVVITLVPGAGYTLVAPTNATVVLLDDESAVSVVVGVNRTYEADGVPGRFTVTRAGGTNLPLTVFLTVGGTAVNGDDYLSVPEAVTIPPGAASVEVLVVGRNDDEMEGDETVRLALAPASTYDVVLPGFAVVTLVDDESNRRPSVAIVSPEASAVQLAETNSALVLEGTSQDDGQPASPGVLALAWRMASGPRPVEFSDRHAAVTLARFAAAGEYVLQLTADDGQLSGTAEVNVFVGAAGGTGNVAPRVDAGTDILVPFGGPIELAGTADDDGLPLPPGALVAIWSRVSGPGTVTFNEAGEVATAVTFSEPGVQRLRLTADDGQVRTASEITVHAYSLPMISLRAVGTNLAEAGPVSGRIEVVRSGELAVPTRVELAFTGTAASGGDYQAVPDSVRFEAGVGSLWLEVVPIVDDRAEGDESVEIALKPSADYVLGSTRDVTLILQDLPFDRWRFVHFSAAELQETNGTGELGDFDGDGWVTLVEYAFDRDPRVPETFPALAGSIEASGNPDAGTTGGGGFVATFQRRKAPTDLAYELETSSDGNQWSAGLSSSRLVSRVDDGNGITETVRYVVSTTPSAGHRFVRLRITRVTRSGPGGNEPVF